MTGVTRGARLWTLDANRNPCAVIVVDKGPDGWWVSFEDRVDDRGHAVMEQRSARSLYPSRAAAIGVTK